MGLFSKSKQVISYTIDKGIYENLSVSVVDGQVAISAPWYLSNRKINQFVIDKKNWILKKLSEYEEKNNSKESLFENKVIMVFGIEYFLKVEYKFITSPELNLQNRIIIINLPIKYKNTNNIKAIDLILEKFYQKIAENEVESIMEKYRINLKIAPNDYKFMKMDNEFGKFLEGEKIILINPEIVKYNKEVLEYIILHEFCHLKYKTHCKNFYKIIKNFIPNYKEIENSIKGKF